MVYLRCVLLMMCILVAELINARAMRPATASQKSTVNYDLPAENKQESSQEFWKIFMGGVGDALSESEEKMPQKDALKVVDAMNKVSDAFNQDYLFTEPDLPLFMSQLTMFLKDAKHQLVLKNFLQVLKDNIKNFPEKFSNIAINLQEAINNKNQEQFYFIYSSLERYFRGLPTKPLIIIRQAGWFARIKNRIMNRARSLYGYYFN